VEAVLLGRDWDHHVAVAIGPDFLHAAPLPLRRAVSLRAEPRPTGTGEVLRVSGTRSWGTGLRIDETFILGPDLDPKLRFTSRYVNTTFRAVEVLELDTALHPATEERRAELVTAAALQIDANRFPAPGAGAGLQLALERRHALTELDDHSWAVEPMEQGATRCRLWQANTCSDEALVEAVSPELLEAFQDSQGEGRCAFALLDYIVSGHTLAVEGRQACKQSTKPERR